MYLTMLTKKLFMYYCMIVCSRMIRKAIVGNNVVNISIPCRHVECD